MIDIAISQHLGTFASANFYNLAIYYFAVYFFVVFIQRILPIKIDLSSKYRLSPKILTTLLLLHLYLVIESLLEDYFLTRENFSLYMASGIILLGLLKIVDVLLFSDWGLIRRLSFSHASLHLLNVMEEEVGKSTETLHLRGAEIIAGVKTKTKTYQDVTILFILELAICMELVVATMNSSTVIGIIFAMCCLAFLYPRTLELKNTFVILDRESSS